MDDRSDRTRSVFRRRRAGILLHPTSLPHAPAEGALGRHAYHFIDFLRDAGQTVWQMLPLNPPHVERSPYRALSACGADPLLVSLELASQWGWLSRPPPEAFAAPSARAHWLDELASGFAARARDEDLARYEQFCRAQADWLDGHVLFAVLRADQGRPWTQWPAPLREREPQAMDRERRRLAVSIHREQVVQFAFRRQWEALRHYAGANGVLLFGDLPIFVAHDSADVWAHREYFRLDSGGEPLVVAGCPPDYYSATGQRWGNPLYDWDQMAADGFAWWKRRMQTQLALFDLVRIDHFRGFEACWEIPVSAQTAAQGRWVKVPGRQLFDALTESLGPLPVVAEDLGIITSEVIALRERYGFPGMRVLQFAFDGNPHNPHLPHEHEANSLVYTGTHDNDTTLAWFESLPAPVRRHVMDYVGGDPAAMPWALNRLALASVSRLCILPLQDVLALGNGHRMNTPGTAEGNWRWRFDWSQLTSVIAGRLKDLTGLYGRA
ncbi:MAG: 4-alpha-glucanotransferase [Chromatiales bacterium]